MRSEGKARREIQEKRKMKRGKNCGRPPDRPAIKTITNQEEQGGTGGQGSRGGEGGQHGQDGMGGQGGQGERGER